MSILRKEGQRVDHDLLWASIGHPLDIHWTCFQFFRLKVMIYLQTTCFPMGRTTPSHGKVRPFPDARVLTPRRSRIFVTSASTMHTLMSVLRFGHILSSPGMPWDGCGNLGTWSDHQPMPFGPDADGPFAAIATGKIGAAGYQLLRISGFCCCFKVQL